MLSDIFGYDKYSEITSEHAIRGTYCDLAIKVDRKLHLLIEVKAIGLDLKDSYVKQAVDYAANQGMEWILLRIAPTFFHNGSFTRLVEDAIRHHLNVFESARNYQPIPAGVDRDLTRRMGPIEPVLQRITSRSCGSF